VSPGADRYRAQLLEAVRLALPPAPPDAGRLAALLYEQWYAPATGTTPGWLDPAEVAEHYRAADAAGGRFEPGWVVLHPEDALARIGPPRSPWQVPAARGEETRWVDPIDLLFADGVGLRPPAGSSIAVSARRDSSELLPGWWTTLSAAWSKGSPPLVRLYWSVPAEKVCRLVEGLTAGLDPDQPYALKCPLDLDRCRRPDAVVLYLPGAAWGELGPGLAAAYRRVRRWLRPRAPALTLELAPGLALAEDPGDDSFGAHRCRIVADGLATARRDGVADPDALGDAAAAALGRHGIGADAPYRNPGSTATYPWDPG
jgi:type III HopA1-like effector protein